MTSLILLSDWQSSQIEFWKQIPWAYGYDVSSFGRVRCWWIGRGNKRHINAQWHLLKQTLMPKGYLVVAFHGRQWRVNRLVAMVFLANPENLPITNHKNGVKIDNRQDNIEWATELSNQRHAWETGLKNGMLYKMRKYSDSTIAEFRKRHAAGDPLTRLAREYGIDKGLAHRIIKRTSYAQEIDRSIPVERLELRVL